MALRAACLQMALQPGFLENVQRAGALAQQAKERGAQLALLPEYWFLPATDERISGASPEFRGAAAALQDISREVGMALAGNVVEPHQQGFLNKLLVFDSGALVAEQAKLHPMPTEERWGVKPWRGMEVKSWHGAAVGSLVCADVLHPEAARILAIRGAEIVLVPVMSYLKPRDETKEVRKAMFLARAYDNACFVLKAGSVARLAGGQLVGRSLIASPWAMLAEAKDELSEEILLADLDIARLREERKRSLSLDRRHPEAYSPLSEPSTRSQAKGEGGFDIEG